MFAAPIFSALLLIFAVIAASLTRPPTAFLPVRAAGRRR